MLVKPMPRLWRPGQPVRTHCPRCGRLRRLRRPRRPRILPAWRARGPILNSGEQVLEAATGRRMLDATTGQRILANPTPADCSCCGGCTECPESTVMISFDGTYTKCFPGCDGQGATITGTLSGSFTLTRIPELGCFFLYTGSFTGMQANYYDNAGSCTSLICSTNEITVTAEFTTDFWTVEVLVRNSDPETNCVCDPELETFMALTELVLWTGVSVNPSPICGATVEVTGNDSGDCDMTVGPADGCGGFAEGGPVLHGDTATLTLPGAGGAPAESGAFGIEGL